MKRLLWILPFFAIILLGYATTFYIYQGQYYDAMSDSPNNFNSLKDVLNKIDKLPQIDTNNILSLISFNQALAELDNPEGKIEKLLINATSVDSMSTSADNLSTASMAYFNLGNYYVIRQEFGKALDQYVQAIKKDSNNLDAKFNYELLLRLLKQQGKLPGKKGKGEGEQKKGDIKIPGLNGNNDDNGIGW